MDELRRTLNDLANKAIADRNFLTLEMDRTYKFSPLTDVLALNSVYQMLQEKAVAWEYVQWQSEATLVVAHADPVFSAHRTEFHELEKVYLPSEKDIRRSEHQYWKGYFPG